tara:strand:- start:2785 stop:3594 length:810 start_codon:yes stop_codon:yes gene_type:complete
MGLFKAIGTFAGTAGGGAIIGGAITGIASLFGGGAKKREAYRARLERDRLKGELTILEKNRQTIINPYEGVTDISSMATDLSGKISNPWANLGVATQAADMQIEEADIALANTLDVLRATGASAGGATALAQAALQSKKGVTANIEQQEAANEKLRAKGESELERLQMSEAQRIQGVQMSEAQRLQQADIAGKAYEFENRERRQTEELNRKQAQITGQAQTAVAASQGAAAIYSSGLSSIGNIASAYAGNSNIPTVEIDQDGDPTTKNR